MPAPYEQRKLEKSELYDLVNDMSEATNAASLNPKMIEQLEKEAEAARSELGDALTKRNGKGTREPGKLEAPARQSSG
jgi:arylsulfatase